MADTHVLVSGAQVLTPVEIVLPVMRGVLGIWVPTDFEAAAVRNWKEGGRDGAAVGALTYGSGYFSSSNHNNRITTGIAEPAESTQYVIARSSAAFSSSTTRPIIAGIFRFQDTGYAGTSFRVTGTPSSAPAATINFSAARDASGVPTLVGVNLNVPDFSKWTLLCGRVKAGAVAGARLFNDLTNGTSGSADASTARTLANTSGGTNILTMGNCSSLQYGPVDVMYYVPCNVVHTDAEMLKVAAAIRQAVSADYGVTV